MREEEPPTRRASALAQLVEVRSASDEQQADLEIIEDGLGIWWEQLDDGLSVPALLGQPHV